MKVVFLGTPEFSIPSLKAIMNSNHKVIGVVTKLDKPLGRGKKVQFSPVKEFALKNNLPVFQYAKISRDGVEDLKKLAPDIMVTASFGQILSQEVIDIPKYGIINVHGSLLPLYRGASPIQSAILNGDTETGITIMKTELGLDTGDIILTEKTEIKSEETAGELSKKLSVIGANLLIKALDQIENGTAVYIKQPFVNADVTTRINKEDGKIIWDKSAIIIKNQILAQNPSPIAFSYLNGELCKFYRATIDNSVMDSHKPVGTVIEPTSVKNGLYVQCGSGVLKVLELQLEGCKVLAAKDFINGRKIKIGDIFVADDSYDTNSPIVIK